MAYEYQRTDWNDYDPNLTLEENMKRNAVATEELLDRMDEGIFQANKPYEVGTVTVADENNDPNVEIVDGEEKRVFNFVLPAGQPGAQGENGADGANGLDGKSAYTIALENGFVGTEEEWLASIKGEKGDPGTNGADGKSAYQIAVDGGFEGDETAWLASLKGADGKSNFEVAVENGFEGTKAEWLEQIRAEKGEKGDPGVDGKSAYEIAKEETGFTGTAVEWIASLKGEQGEKGADGVDGEAGTPGAAGAPGKSVYDIAVEEGYDGTVQEWLASLKGADGKNNYQLAVEAGFEGTLEEWLAQIQAEKGEKGDPGEPGVAGAPGVDGRDGNDGKSAYELAQDGGFTGTVEEWLASLKGEAGADGADGTNGTDGVNGADGADGKSAYQIAVDGGFEGDETAWLASLKGEKGDKGDPGTIGDTGADGQSAYDLAKANGFEGTEAEWLASLKGDKGDEARISDVSDSYQAMIDAWDTYPVGALILIVDPTDKEHNASLYAKKLGEEPKYVSKLEAVKGDKGDPGEPGQDGAPGVPGQDGANGKSAYEIALEAGAVPEGTEDEGAWVATLKGEQGIQGETGASAYDAAVAGGFEGTQEEWLNSLKGESGVGNKWVVAATALEAGATAPEGAVSGDLVLDQDGDVYQVSAEGTLPEVLVNLKGAKGDPGEGSGAAPLNLQIGNITSGAVPAAALRADAETGITYLDITFPVVPVTPIVEKGEVTIPASGWVAAESGTGYTNEVAISHVTATNQVDVSDSANTTTEMTQAMTDCNVDATTQKAGALVFTADAAPTIDIIVFVTTTTNPSEVATTPTE